MVRARFREVRTGGGQFFVLGRNAYAPSRSPEGLQKEHSVDNQIEIDWGIAGLLTKPRARAGRFFIGWPFKQGELAGILASVFSRE